jgi:hypothetical protein
MTAQAPALLTPAASCGRDITSIYYCIALLMSSAAATAAALLLLPLLLLLLSFSLSVTAHAADAVAYCQIVTYRWLVTDSAGPGPADAGSIMWMYHSHVDEAAYPAAGLMGAIIITPQGNANQDATPKDVSRCVCYLLAVVCKA